jgi:hypothetical protein
MGLEVPEPYTESRIRGTVRRSEVHSHRALELYPKKHEHSGDFRGHLHFALKNEPTNLAVLYAAFKKSGPTPIREWALQEPTGLYSRKAWFLYEFLSGETIDLPNAKTGKHADVLNPKHHIVASRQTSTRHRLWNNLLGVPGYCPTIRRTQKLAVRIAEALDKEVAAMTRAVDPDILRRAISYLYSKETKSTFEIEGEKPSPQREQRFVSALADVARFDLFDKAALIELQNKIVDPRYAAKDWRDFQNFVGETVEGYRETVHLVCPKPGDVNDLMMALMKAGRRVTANGVDPVIAAALVSFGFVFIHPFEDGNGRIHRFLIHSVLAKTGFTPEGLIFPVSVAIVRDRRGYDAALETFSKPLLSLIKWRLNAKLELVVEGNTAHHYRYFDATALAEYLYDRVAETIHKDLAGELDFLEIYDRAYRAVRDVVDMPNRKVSLFVRICMQNDGRLPKGRRKMFAELTDAEITAMESAIRLAQKVRREEKVADSDL